MASPEQTNYKPLTPLPMRITEMQSKRLGAARDRDDLSIQEHVRRALDMYLDWYETNTERVRASGADLNVERVSAGASAAHTGNVAPLADPQNANSGSSEAVPPGRSAGESGGVSHLSSGKTPPKVTYR